VTLYGSRCRQPLHRPDLDEHLERHVPHVYVGLQLIGAAGTKLPTSVIRERRPGPRSITLRPGKSAWTRIHWTAAAGAGEPATAPCEPQSVTTARSS
jgi:hypothetical protein